MDKGTHRWGEFLRASCSSPCTTSFFCNTLEALFHWLYVHAVKSSYFVSRRYIGHYTEIVGTKHVHNTTSTRGRRPWHKLYFVGHEGLLCETLANILKQCIKQSWNLRGLAILLGNNVSALVVESLRHTVTGLIVTQATKPSRPALISSINPSYNREDQNYRKPTKPWKTVPIQNDLFLFSQGFSRDDSRSVVAHNPAQVRFQLAKPKARRCEAVHLWRSPKPARIAHW